MNQEYLRSVRETQDHDINKLKILTFFSLENAEKHNLVYASWCPQEICFSIFSIFLLKPRF